MTLFHLHFLMFGQIYVTLEGASQDKTEANFHSDSVDLKIHDVGGKNYRCSVPKLNKTIIPEQSKVLVKPKRIIITLKKADGGNWIDLHKKEDKVITNFPWSFLLSHVLEIKVASPKPNSFLLVVLLCSFALIYWIVILPLNSYHLSLRSFAYNFFL